MKKFKFTVTLSEEDLKDDKFYNECLEQPYDGLEMIRQAIEDALVYNNIILDSNSKKVVTILDKKSKNVSEAILLYAAGRLATEANNVIKSDALYLSRRISVLREKLEEYNNSVINYER